MKKIVITGATSMLGTTLTEIAVRENIDVYAIIRPDTKRADRIIKSPNVHLVYGFLDKLTEIEDLPEDCDVFYHFAWAGTSKTDRDNPVIQQKNISYTIDAVELAKKAGCHRFVFAGSQAEYGPTYDVIDEETKFSPVICYGVAKQAAGMLSKKKCEEYGIKHIWGRICSVYGPHDNKGTMIDYALTCFESGETAHFSTATQMWNYLYETDAGEYFYHFGQDYVTEGTYLVANMESEPLRNYIQIIAEVYGNGAKAEFAPSDGKKLPGLNVDNKKTINNIAYKPTVKFKDGIREIVRLRSVNKT